MWIAGYVGNKHADAHAHVACQPCGGVCPILPADAFIMACYAICGTWQSRYGHHHILGIFRLEGMVKWLSLPN